MQTQLTDKKLSIIFDRYRDRDFARNAAKEVEDIRRKALTVGAATTAGAFVLNEFARLTMRSRKFKQCRHCSIMIFFARNQSH